MNLPNILSVTRVLLVPAIVALFYVPGYPTWVPGILFSLGSITDFLDGQIARRKDLVTDFGKFLDPVAKALEVASMLKKKKKCDLVICISHLGWDTDLDDDIEMASGSRYIDLILGGHSHTYFEELRYVKDLDGKNVPVDQNGKHGIWIGKMVVNLAKK